MGRLTKDERMKQWYRDARIGLFLHWGMHTGEHETDPFGPDLRYPHQSVEEFDYAVEQAGWQASHWIDTAKRLRAKYITLATFHCEQGYLKIWKSNIPGSKSTRRDYLQELLDEAAVADIRIIVYINRDSKNAIHGGIEWLDKDAYQAYKQDPTVDIHSREDYLTYSIEVMEELLDNYPAVAGFWFDGYHDKLEAQEVFARLHQKRDDLILINNDFSSGPVDDEDAMALEDFGKLCNPPYDWASGTWVGPGDKEFAFKAKLDWWYMGEGNTNWGAYELNYADIPSNAATVKRIVSVAGTSWNAHLGFGPKVGGEFPHVLEDFVGHFDRFMAWAADSIYGTSGGGYDAGGFPPGQWQDGAYGITTVTADGRTHYLHVLEAPAGKLLVLPDAGYVVEAAVELKSGAALAFYQTEGRLEIVVPSWEGVELDGDLIIKLSTAERRRIVSPERMTAKASSEHPSTTAANVLSSDYRLSFRGATTRTWPQTLTLRLEEAESVAGLCITQPETGPVLEGGFAAPLSERIRGFAVHVSSDGAEWGAPVASGELRNQRGMQVIPFAPVDASYVRLTALGNYGGTGTFQIIELQVLQP
ncbi:alpha-L-fucosidase [Paenibacillus albus]|uniref:alpha-L-fucosidase n=1 Tax=Paenibacillus albus TaxID=2495582 RepID=A0A3S9AAZ6_9BACL|nr:alpha-L-fucosidase [Paenibacillus albus]AZN42870.1 hypothetical protein EJC50_26635 [Paenibacillus albus]